MVTFLKTRASLFAFKNNWHIYLQLRAFISPYKYNIQNLPGLFIPMNLKILKQLLHNMKMQEKSGWIKHKQTGRDKWMVYFDWKDGSWFKKDWRSGTSADLELEPSGAKERELNGFENGVDLLLLCSEQMLPRRRSVDGVFLKDFLTENDGGDSSLSSISARNSAAAALSWYCLDRMVWSSSRWWKWTRFWSSTWKRRQPKVPSGGAPPLGHDRSEVSTMAAGWLRAMWSFKFYEGLCTVKFGVLSKGLWAY